ncbi:hypothetical protein SK128_022590, partial [Halocaridina rubra]
MHGSCRERFDDISSDIESQPIDEIKDSRFSIQIDEASVTDISHSYDICFINDDCKLCEELHFLKLSKTYATGSSNSEVAKFSIGDKQVPFEDLVSCPAADDTPSRV